MQEEIKEVDRSENQSSVIPPFSLTVEERIEWFRKKVREFEILKSDNLTKEFLGRVLEFFNNECDVRFFMTWISPVESFGRREFLALESLFKVHPHGCLLILSRDLDSIQGYRILKPLLDRKFKVAAITPDLSFLFKNTPAETWFEEIKSGNKDPGEIPLAQNLSNLIRLAVLYKFGGIYLDTDFIVLKSFADLRNAIGAQSIDVSKSWTRLNNAVLVFDMNHPLLLKFIEEFASTFDGNKWGHNGPYLVSRVVQKVAGRPGYNFTVLPPMAFYPVGWNRIGGFFKKPVNKVESRWVNAKLLQLSGETYGLHLWNRQSSKFSIEEGSIMGRLISDHCVICEYKYSS
jgi:lactosylceramide 4-alpha-galactosyltransferase